MLGTEPDLKVNRNNTLSLEQVVLLRSTDQRLALQEGKNVRAGHLVAYTTKPIIFQRLEMDYHLKLALGALNIAG